MAKDYNVENVGINITSSAQQALASLNALKASLAQTNAQFKDMNMQLTKIKVGATGAGGIPNVSLEMAKVKTATEGATGKIKIFNTSLGGMGKMLGGLFSLRMLMNFLGKSSKQMIDFAENYNLFTVSMGDMKDEALVFQDAMNKALGTNMSQTMRYQGFFQNLTSALGATNRQAFEMSKTFTLLTYDMASLFNWTPDVAFNRLQAGIVGQTKPLRYAGVDVTQQTIQPILQELGIEKQVIELTQSEKVMLRMIAILRQTGNAQNDFSRTLESPANQIRVLSDQTKELYRWIGGTFIGLISKALPYINGFVMALVEVFKMFSRLLGFTEEDYDFMNGGDNDLLPEIEEEAEGADQAIKKLTGSLRKFDEINNISMRGNAGGSVGGAFGATQAKLWEELQKQMDYFDDTFSDVNSKAVAIKEQIMKWLGIFFQLNDEGDTFTGKITFLGNLMLGLLGMLAFAGVVKAIAGVVTALATIKTALGIAGGTGLIASVGLFGGALILLGGAVVIGAILTLRDKLGEIEEKVKEGKPLSKFESMIWGWKETVDKAKESFGDFYKDVFEKPDDLQYSKSKFKIFLDDMNYHLWDVIYTLRKFSEDSLKAFFPMYDQMPQESPFEMMVQVIIDKIKELIKWVEIFMDFGGATFYKWLTGVDLTVKAPPAPTPPPPPKGDDAPTILPDKTNDNKIVIEMDKYEVGKVIGTENTTGTPSLSW